MPSPASAVRTRTGSIARRRRALPAGRDRTACSRLALAVLCAAQFLVVLDITIVNVALPAMGDDLALSGQGLSLVVSLYALVFGALLLPAGRLADLAGGRRIFILGMGLFGAASLACGWHPAATS